MVVSLLFGADADDFARFDGFVARAAFGVEERKQLAQGIGVGPVAQEIAFARDADEALVFQFVEVMRERGTGDVELGLEFADDQAIGVGREQEPHDAQAGFSAKGGEHVGVAGGLFVVGRLGRRHRILYFYNNRNIELVKFIPVEFGRVARSVAGGSERRGVRERAGWRPERAESRRAPIHTGRPGKVGRLREWTLAGRPMVLMAGSREIRIPTG